MVAGFATDEETAAAFSARTGIETRRFDVADPEACDAQVADIGPVSILINNAGFTRDASFRKVDRRSWDAVIGVNLGGPFNMVKAVWPGMQARRFGRIVNIGSINGQAGQFGQVNYSAAKAALHGFTKSLALEGAPVGITVNLVAPGYVATDMVAAMPPSILAQIVEQIPVGRLGRPEEIARAVAFFCSEEAGFITGSTLSINGGQNRH